MSGTRLSVDVAATRPAIPLAMLAMVGRNGKPSRRVARLFNVPGHCHSRHDEGWNGVKMTDAIPVTIENFARAETDRMFASLSERAGGANRWHHDRETGAPFLTISA